MVLVSTGCALSGVYFEGQRGAPASGADCKRAQDPRFLNAAGQLEAYFAGELVEFDLRLELRGTPFQRAVWNVVASIPFGDTRSYSEIARSIGIPSAARAVGAANGRNPLSIVVPCHRVVAADRSLCGYGGGIEAKRWLLDHEASVADARPHPNNWLTLGHDKWPHGSHRGRARDSSGAAVSPCWSPPGLMRARKTVGKIVLDEAEELLERTREQLPRIEEREEPEAD
jgi:methylated-DNA-[protein]-cysteine S-methyltransferase